MHILKINEFDEMYNIIKEAFVKSEIRPYDILKCLFKERKIVIYGYRDQEQLIGVVLCWELNTCVFLESFAIDKNYRNKGLGSTILEDLKKSHKNKTLILEVEEPFDDMSKRRINFYERNGFILSEYGYLLPQINEEISDIPLLIMSYPTLITNLEYTEIKKEIFEKVYRNIL